MKAKRKAINNPEIGEGALARTIHPIPPIPAGEFVKVMRVIRSEPGWDEFLYLITTETLRGWCERGDLKILCG